jgi:hypothetical protein
VFLLILSLNLSHVVLSAAGAMSATDTKEATVGAGNHIGVLRNFVGDRRTAFWAESGANAKESALGARNHIVFLYLPGDSFAAAGTGAGAHAEETTMGTGDHILGDRIDVGGMGSAATTDRDHSRKCSYDDGGHYCAGKEELAHRCVSIAAHKRDNKDDRPHCRKGHKNLFHDVETSFSFLFI